MMYRGILLALLLPAAQADPIPRTFALDPDAVLLYDLHDVKKSERAGDFLLFGCELRTSGFERFTRYRLSELPYEFLFQHPPKDVKPGQSWKVDITVGGAGLTYYPYAIDGLCPRFIGTYTLAGMRRIEKKELCVVTGKFDIRDARVAGIDSPTMRKKLKVVAEVKDRNSKIGSLEVELRIRPETGVLEEAFYRFKLEINDTVWSYNKSGTLVRQPVSANIDHHRRWVLAREPETIDRRERERIRKLAWDSAKRGVDSIVGHRRANGDYKGVESKFRIVLANDAVKAIRAIGGDREHAGIKPVLDDLRHAPSAYGGSLEALGALCSIYFPVTLDRPLASFDLGELGPVNRDGLNNADRQSITDDVRRMVTAQQNKWGLWAVRYHLATDDSLTITASAKVANSLHWAARLGWDVTPKTWKLLVDTLHETAMVVNPEAEIHLTIGSGSPYIGIFEAKKHRSLTWCDYPVYPAMKEFPHGAPTVCAALVCLAVARVELSLAGKLDTETEKKITDLQRGAMAWVCTHYTARSTDAYGFGRNPSREFGTNLFPVLAFYGIERIGEHDPYTEYAIITMRDQRKDGGWGIDQEGEAHTAVTSEVVQALCQFGTRGWKKP